MITCSNCHGEGLAGAGDQPWLKQGAVGTCKPCGGTGKVSEPNNPSIVTPVEATPEAVEAPKVESAELSPESSEPSLTDTAPTETVPS